MKRLRWLLLASLLISLACAQGERELPLAPAGMILDQGQVLLPERAAILSQRLKVAAEERGIWVYVVTLPSLGVPASKQRKRLINLGDFYRNGWLKDRVGVVLLFDDESGSAMVAASEEANRQYPPLQRNMQLEETLRLIRRESLRRDKVEKTALAVIEVISRLEDDKLKKKRRDQLVNLAMAGIAIAGVGVIVLVRWARSRR